MSPWFCIILYPIHISNVLLSYIHHIEMTCRNQVTTMSIEGQGCIYRSNFMKLYFVSSPYLVNPLMDFHKTWSNVHHIYTTCRTNVPITCLRSGSHIQIKSYYRLSQGYSVSASYDVNRLMDCAYELPLLRPTLSDYRAIGEYSRPSHCILVHPSYAQDRLLKYRTWARGRSSRMLQGDNGFALFLMCIIAN